MQSPVVRLSRTIQETSKETLVERKVTYTLEVNGQLVVIENVPAWVNVETGEQLFSPDTVERLQRVIWARRQPKRVIQVPVYEFAYTKRARTANLRLAAMPRTAQGLSVWRHCAANQGRLLVIESRVLIRVEMKQIAER